MKKLEDIPKKNVFEVPEGYFDRLPGIIQARIAEEKKEPIWVPYFRFSLKFAFPVLAIGLAVFFFLSKPATQSAEELLASVDSADLIAYLEDSDVSADDLMEIAPLSEDEAQSIQESSIKDMNLDENDMDILTDEFGVDNY